MQDTKPLQFKENPYQYTRGIRFRIEPVVEDEKFSKKTQAIQSAGNEEPQLSDLAENLLKFHSALIELLFYKTKPQHKNLSKADQKRLIFSVSVKKAWLREFHKDLFYLEIGKKQDGKYKSSKYKLSELKSIGNELKKRFEDWKRYSLELKDASQQPKESKVRHSDIAEYIRVLSGRDQLIYMERFLEEISSSDSSSDKKIDSLKNQLNDLRKKLKSAQELYLPSQSSGIEIAKASFNYYTINKKSKEYYEKEPQKAKDQLDKNRFSIIKSENSKYSWEFFNKSSSGGNQENSQQKIFQFKSDQEKKWIEKYCKEKLETDLKQEVHLTLDQTYRAMKDFKAEQKSIFYEITTHIASGQNNSYEDKNPSHFLKGWQFSHSQQNLNGMNTAFSLFQFTDKTIKSNKYTIDKILSPYKEGKNQTQNNKVTRGEGCYQAFVDLTKQIQESGTKKNKKTQIKKPLHPKHRFLAQRQNRFKGDLSVSSYNNNKDAIPYKSQRPKQDRGTFLFGKGCYFKEYGKFCETYKKIAQKRGRLNAQIKGIEKERREALQTDFWSLIYCNREKRQLWLIPKDKREKAKNFIYGPERKNCTSEDSQCLSCFESLTMRALHKLCFAEQSSFVKDMPEDLRKLQKSAKEFNTKDTDENRKKEKQEKKKKKTLEFFKKLLKSNYAREKLPVLKAFDSSSIDTFNPMQKEAWRNLDKAEKLEKFEEYLEKACYHVKKITITGVEKQDFLEKNDVTVLNISSYDLEGRNKNQKPTSENKYHTDLWKAFWDNTDNPNKKDAKVKGFQVGEVRLNPEVKIYYRKADDDLKKYFEKRKFPSKFKHRRLQNGFTAHFTLALNAGKRYEELAFAKPEELLNKINDFNQTLNKKMDFKTVWKYGIDRGQKELATLCLVRFNPDKELYKINNKTIVKPIFPKDENVSETIKCWTLKNSNYKEEYTTKKGEKRTRWAIKNLSYFVDEKYLNNKELFEEKNISCLDLTTAKVIKGKIITNGDVLTYLKLKKTVAKRQLYELFQNGKIKGNARLNGSPEEERYRSEGVLNIKTSNGKEKTIYHYHKRFEGILINKEKNIKYNKQSIEDSLNHYLNQLRQNSKKHTPEILKINHLRNAITANMVGVICHLQKTYPGFIILEDLSKNVIDKHRFNNEENISRRLENALYNKFQSLGLVPPHVRDIIQLREQQSKIKSQRQEERKKDLEEKQKTQKEIKNLEKNIEGIKKGIKCARNSEQKEKLKKKLEDNKEKITGLKKTEKILENKLSDEKHQNQSSQIGAIVFIPEKETSKSCPYCEETQVAQNKTDETFKERKNEEKFKQHRFICGDCQPCGFDTYHFKKEVDRAENYTPELDKQKYKEDFKWFEALDDPDKVAAYNIAKKITDPEEIGKMGQVS